MKNNGKFWRIIGIAVVLLLALISTVYAYGKLNGRFEALEAKVEKVEDTRERLIRVEEGVGYLKQAVDRIEKKL